MITSPNLAFIQIIVWVVTYLINQKTCITKDNYRQLRCQNKMFNLKSFTMYKNHKVLLGILKGNVVLTKWNVTGDTSQLVRCLLHKYENLCSDPQTLYKDPSTVTQVFKPSAGNQKYNACTCWIKGLQIHEFWFQ